MAEQPIDPRLVEQTRQHIRQLVAEINQLANSDVPPQTFFGEFLQRVVAAVAAVGGAVWSRDGQQPPRLQHQVNFQMSGLLDESAGAGGHVPLLLGAFQHTQARLIPPQSGAGTGAEQEAGANQSDWALLVAPMQVDKQTVGVVELLMDPTRRPTALENAVRFVQELCEIGAGYLKNRQLRQMLNQQHLWSQLETFVREIHGSLTPKEVAYIVASEGKRLVSCDRLSVALQYGSKTVIEGVSGQEVVERKSTLVQLMKHLCSTVLQSGEQLLYTGEQRDDLPPAVRDALDDFVAESGSKILGITLLRTHDKEGVLGKPFGCLVGEQLEDASAPGTLLPRMEVVGQHGAIALANALAHHRVFMLPVWRTVGNATEWMRGNRLAKLSVAVGGLTVLVLSMIFVPMELRMHGDGKFVPENRRPVYAAEDGDVVDVTVDHGEIVKPDQVVVRIRSRPLELERDNRLKDMQRAEAMLEATTDTMVRSGAGGVAPETAVNVPIARFERDTHFRAIQLLDKRLASNEVRPPIEGMVATWEPKRTLLGRPVKRGDMLLQISELESDAQCQHGHQSSWILDVKMPEHKIGHIREAESRRIAENRAEPLKAAFILSSHPQRRFRGHVERIATTAEFDDDLKEHIVKIRIVPDDIVKFHVSRVQAEEDPNVERVAKIEMELKDGKRLKLNPEAEVQARIDCGKCSLGYWALGELMEWFYETVWF